MKNKILFVIFFFLLAAGIYSQENKGGKLLPPETGIYAGVFPDMGSTEDSITKNRISEYIKLTGHKPVWICFSNNWFKGIKFPLAGVKTVAEFGAIPYIRIMPRHDWTEGRPDFVYGLELIADGTYDNDLKKWADDAKTYGKPLLAEFAPEMNGNWFPWSGLFNGKKSGAELYKDAHRHVVEIMRDEGADNITWLFHVNAVSEPVAKWNTMKAYYPGDKYIDWIGMSVYGSQKPGATWEKFLDVFQTAYWQMEKISSKKPLFIAEFGVVEDPAMGSKQEWIKEAFTAITGGMYPRIKAISYWHSSFDNEDGSISNMRVDSSPEVLKTYKDFINSDIFKAALRFSYNK
ncbi:MAG: glycosyl hydrolase [Ignavibacteria bacterium]|nr:glycosyl hydrolase [Ignavibacteria bacterium]